MHMHRDYSSYLKKITWMSWGPGDPRKHTSRHIKIALPKINNKERIIKAAREKKTVTYKGVPIRLPADFSKETL